MIFKLNYYILRLSPNFITFSFSPLAIFKKYSKLSLSISPPRKLRFMPSGSKLLLNTVNIILSRLETLTVYEK